MRWLLAVLIPGVAAAAPDDVVLSAMTGQGDVDPDAYHDLVADLGTIVGNGPVHPADTTGTFGFDLAATTTVAFVDAYRQDGPTPWVLSNADGTPPDYFLVPTLSARKGLPLSLEVGATAGWIGGSGQAVAGGFARAGLVEGHKPYPDLTAQIGYAGYVGNPELGVGVLDLGITIGQRFRMYRTAKVTHSHFVPYATFQVLRVTARHRLDRATAAEVGAVTYGGDGEPALWIPRPALGFQISSGKAMLRFVGAWAPTTLPTLTAGLGFEI